MGRIILLILLIPLLLGWGMFPAQMEGSGTGGGEGSCTNVLWDSLSETRTADTDIYDVTTQKYAGMTYNEASAYTICSVTMAVNKKAGDISDRNYYVEIYDMSGTALNTKLGSSVAVVGNNSWVRQYLQEFEFTTPVVLSASTDYAIVITVDHAVDTSNYAEFDNGATNVIPSAEKSTWTDTKALNQSSGENFDHIMKVMYQ